MKKICFLFVSLFVFVGFARSGISQRIRAYPVQICGHLSFDKEKLVYVMHPFDRPREDDLQTSIVIEDGYDSFTMDLRQHFNDRPSVRPFCVKGYLKQNGNLLGFRGFYFLDRSGFSVGN